MREPFAREEMMLSALLALTGIAPALQADPPAKDGFWVKLEMSERPARNGKPPMITYAGTTNLPDGTRLDMEIYYRRYILARNLIYKALPVVDGRFSVDLVVYPNARKNLAGPHLIRTWVYLDQQAPAIQAVLAGGPRNRLFEEIYQIGTPEEGEAARLVVYTRMLGFLDTYEKILNEIKEHAHSLKDRFNRPAWKRTQAGWEERALAVEKEARAVNEFLALDLDVFVKTNFEDIRTGISVVANWTAIALQRPGDVSIAQNLHQKRLGVTKLIDEVRKVADPNWSTAETIFADLELLQTLLRDALKKPEGPHRETRAKFVQALFRVEPHSPEKNHYEYIEIVGNFRKFLKALPDDLPTARQLQASMNARIDELKTHFKAK